MHNFWADRCVFTFSAVALLTVTIHPAFAQKGGAAGGSAGSGSGSIGGVGSTTRGTLGSIPNSTLNSPNTVNTRPIFLSGKVMFDDGTQPNPDIRIERVCGGSPHLEAHTDSKGRFSFQVGQNPMVDTDAADTSTAIGRTNGQFGSSQGSFGAATSNRMDPLWNCELRASYPGYRSDVVDLSNRRSLDDPELGTLVLHRLANVQGSTISMTTALAPHRAQKDYQKGTQLAAKGDFAEAEKRLREATDLYPKFAAAWFTLGDIQQRQGKAEDARRAYESAITADPKYVSPYDRLAVLCSQQGKWEDAANFSKQVIQLNPVEFPSDFWYNALANYKLKKLSEAQKSTEDLLKLDTAHKYPEAETMLAQILLDKRNYQDAAIHLRAYLALVPNATNADQLKKTLAKLDQANAEAKKQ